jgi:hypothetical protein
VAGATLVLSASPSAWVSGVDLPTTVYWSPSILSWRFGAVPNSGVPEETSGDISRPTQQWIMNITGKIVAYIRYDSCYRPNTKLTVTGADISCIYLDSLLLIKIVTIWKLGRTVYVYSMVQRREKEKDSRYIQEASAPASVTVYQTCNIMYICNKNSRS